MIDNLYSYIYIIKLDEDLLSVIINPAYLDATAFIQSKVALKIEVWMPYHWCKCGSGNHTKIGVVARYFTAVSYITSHFYS